MQRDEIGTAPPAGLLERLLADVKLRAYEIHRDRVARHVPGDEAADWRAAEQDVLAAAGLVPGAAPGAGPAPLAADQPDLGDDRPLERMVGALGSLTARDIMHGRLRAVGPDCTLGQLARALDERGVPAVPVVDRHQRILGVASVTDLVHGAALAQASAARLESERPGPSSERIAGEMLAAVRVGEVCSRALIAAPPEATLIELAAMMAGHRVHQVLVVDEDRIVGLVTALDIVSALWSRAPSHPHYTVP